MKEFVLRDDLDPSKAKIHYKNELNTEQLDVVLHAEGPCLVLAGAGSGKTRTITYRVAFLLERGVAPENILLVTFTNKAAQEMLSRVEMLLGRYPTGLWGGTFHSVANRLLRIYADQVGYTQNFTILDQEDAKDLVKVCVSELNIDTSSRRFPSPAKLHSIISYARNSRRSIFDVVENKYPNFFEIAPVIDRVSELYDARKQTADAMDFDDLLLKLNQLLSEKPQICQRLAEQFEYILVDEYQDTNVIQAEIIRQLAGVHKNILVVGDDAQSIYSFRAAEIRNILGFPQTYEGTKTFRLTTNYRSSPEILALANASILQNKDQFKKELTAMRSSLERPNLIPTSNQQQEAQYIAQRILELQEEGIPFSEIAVLFRAAFHSQALEFELMKRDIPYEYRGGLKFFERAHVKDIISFLRVKLNVKDEMAWMRILGLQTGIGLVTAQKFVKQIQEHQSLDELIRTELHIPKRAQVGWTMLQRTLVKMTCDYLPADLIRTVISGDYRDYLETEYPDFMDRLDDLEQFALFAEGYTDLKKFLDEVSLTTDYGAVREQGGYDEEKMILSTIHQAKGLEWDTVFIINLVDGKFPNARALDEDGGLEEERRLFYVAATRARKQLHCSYPNTGGYDTLMISQPSIFLQELPDELFEHVQLKRSFPVSSSWDDGDSPTIVLDEIGERKNIDVSGMSFLRDLDEL